jgi:hypothetical protein
LGSIRQNNADRITHTEEILHQRPIRRPGFRISERDDRRCQFAEAELLHCGSERIRWVESAGVDLAENFAVSELFGGEDAGGPELARRGECGWVEEVVVAVVGVHAAVKMEFGVSLSSSRDICAFGILPETRIVLEDVVAI